MPDFRIINQNTQETASHSQLMDSIIFAFICQKNYKEESDLRTKNHFRTDQCSLCDVNMQKNSCTPQGYVAVP